MTDKPEILGASEARYRAAGLPERVTRHTGPDEGAGRSLIEALLDGCSGVNGRAILCVDSGGRIVLHNDGLQALCGVPDTACEGSLGELTRWLADHGDDLATALGTLLARPPAALAGTLEIEGVRVVHWHRTHFDDEQDASQAAGGGWMWSFEDATIPHQVASALQDAENWLRMFAAHTEGILLELDRSARIVGIWANDARFFAKPDAQLQGCRLQDAIGPSQGSALEQEVLSVLASGDYATYSYCLELGGERRHFVANLARLVGGEPRATMLIQDVTERVRMQSQLQQADRLASMGLLAAGVAHEINNPIAYVLLNLERVEHWLRDDARRKPGSRAESLLGAVEMSLEGCRRVRDIVEQLNGFSRDDPGAVLTPVDVHRALAFAAELSHPVVSPRAQLGRSFGPVPEVLAAEGRLSQVFLNLIVNAAQATEPGHRQEMGDNADIDLVTYTNEQGWAVVEVRDRGVGIPESVLPRIFDPFFTTKPAGEGTGLGLSICRRIVHSLGGEIVAESWPGRGTTLRVALPPAT